MTAPYILLQNKLMMINMNGGALLEAERLVQFESVDGFTMIILTTQKKVIKVFMENTRGWMNELMLFCA